VTTIGRNRDADIHVTDVGVSRNHMSIVREGALYFVEDRASVNGTFVNSRRVTREELANGDCIQLGPRVSFRFSLMDEAQEGVLSRLYDSSVRDPLTGVYNRRHLDARLAGEIAHAVRHGENVSVVFFDIDYFKNVNDRHGHAAGDEVLRVVADIAKRTIRVEDVLARYGGEEFAVVLRDTPVAGAHVLAERIRRRVAETTIPVAHVAVGVTLSFGCASLDCAPSATVAALVQAADRRLYRAKRDGRNRVDSSG
jgi:diguanylate cyclase (GGDEF)-like protein